MKSTAQKLSHCCKWKRHTYETGTKIFFCTLPKCNKKLKIGLALGKESLCWRCGEVFILNEYSVRLARPHCENCHKSKNLIDKTSITFCPPIPKKETRQAMSDLVSRMQRVTKVREDEDEL